MTSRAVIALLVAAGLFGSRPALAIECPRDERDTVSFAHAAAVVASSAAAPAARAAADAWRPICALPVARLDGASAPTPPEAPDAPLVHAAVPDVLTCPAQGPPV